MNIPMNAFFKTIEVLLRAQSRRATTFLSPTLTVKAVYRHKPNGRQTRREVLVTFGQPNYAERLFIKSCRKAGEPFPVKKVQLKDWPKRRS